MSSKLIKSQEIHVISAGKIYDACKNGKLTVDSSWQDINDIFDNKTQYIGPMMTLYSYSYPFTEIQHEIVRQRLLSGNLKTILEICLMYQHAQVGLFDPVLV